jgi:hypothetical protein
MAANKTVAVAGGITQVVIHRVTCAECYSSTDFPTSSISRAADEARGTGWKVRGGVWKCQMCTAPKPKKHRPVTFAKGRIYNDPQGVVWECLGTRGHKALMRRAGETGTPVGIAKDFLSERLKPYRQPRATTVPPP